MTRKTTYMDIGHSAPNATLWLWKDGRLWTWSRFRGTHEDRYGIDAMHYWRGRFEEKTCRLSITPPVTMVGSWHSPSKALQDALSERFGECEVYEFNPRLRRRWKNGHRQR